MTTTDLPRADERGLSEAVVVSIVYIAAFSMCLLDATIVNVSLPAIGREFGQPTSTIEWVATGYLLSLAVFIPASGWLGDRFGTKRVLLGAIGIFTVASLLIALAGSVPQLVAARVLQGVGGGMITPVGMAMMFRAYPPARRRAMAKLLIFPAALAPAVGPIVGGLFVDHLSWRWAFLVNLPIGVGVILFGAISLREHREPLAGRFDIRGFVLSGLALASLLYMFSSAPREGWTSPHVTVSGAVALVAAVILVRVETTIDEPMLKLAVLRNRMFRSGTLTMMFSNGAFISTLFLMPQFIQDARGETATESGLTTSFQAPGLLICSPIAGRLYPILGPRRLMMLGMAMMAGGLVALSFADEGTSLWVVRIWMAVIGGAFAINFVALQTAVFSDVSSADTGRASALYNAARQSAATIGVAMLASAVAFFLSDAPDPSRHARVDAFQNAFLVAAVIAVLGVVAAGRVDDAGAAATLEGRRPSG